MKNDYLPLREVWEFERYLASKPHVWRVEAINLKNSAEALFLYDDEVRQKIFVEKVAPRLPRFFPARVERMLMGFSLENLVKAVLLQDAERLLEVFKKEGGLSWGKDGHNLLKLLSEAKINVSKFDERYLKAWQLCALWAGRYPLPLNENDFPRQRRPLPSREALLKRSVKRIESAHEEGDPLLGADVHDIIHGGVGDVEIETYRDIFSRCDALLPND